MIYNLSKDEKNDFIKSEKRHNVYQIYIKAIFALFVNPDDKSYLKEFLITI